LADRTDLFQISNLV